MKNSNKRPYIISYFFSPVLAIILTSSCASTHQITIEILVPGQINVPLQARELVLINRSLHHDSADDTTSRKKESQIVMENIIVREAAAGFVHVVNDSPAIDSIRTVDLPPADTMNLVLPPDRRTIDSIAGSDSSLVLVSLEYFTMSVTRGKSWRYGYVMEEEQLAAYYGIELAVASSSFWRTFLPSGEIILDEFWQNDTLLALSEGTDIDQALNNLEDPELLYLEAAYWNGYNYARRVLPHWIKADRFYFKLGSRNMRTGHALAMNSQWTDAAELWKMETGKPGRSLAAKAWFNLAVVAEILDKLELALELANKSLEVKASGQTRVYIDLLEQRIKERKQLAEQVG